MLEAMRSKWRRHDIGEVITFARWLLLKPYGNNLISPQTRIWILIARVVVVFMAGVEALAWGFIAYSVSVEEWRTTVGATVGCIVFLVIAAIDATFLMYDLSGAEYDIARADEEQPPPGRMKRLWWRIRRIGANSGVGVLVRVLMVAGSLLVTSPYLAMLLLRDDVTATIEAQNKNAITTARAQVEQSFDEEIAVFAERIRDYEQQSVQDAAGVGPSRRRGRGSTVRTIEARIDGLRVQMAEVEKKKQAALTAFDNTPQAVLARQHQIRLTGNGLQARSNVAKQLQTQPGYEGIKTPIYGFLIGIFAAILALKLLQPRTTRIYFSETLQDAFVEYLDGRLDDLLPVEDRSTSGRKTTPMRFARMWKESYAVQERTAALQKGLTEAFRRHKAYEGTLDDAERIVAADLGPRLAQKTQLEEDLADMQDEADAEEQTIKSLDVKTATRRAFREKVTTRLAELRQNENPDEEAFDRNVEIIEYLLDTQKKLDIAIKKGEGDVTAHKLQLKATKEAINDAQKRINDLTQIIASKGSAKAVAENRRTNARKDHLDEIEQIRNRYRT